MSTHPSAEFKACVNLERQGWDTFCPAIAKTIKSGRRVRTELRPLFPGYTLVALDTARDAWRSVNGTIGVRQIVHFGSDPSPLPTGVVEALQAMSDDQGRVDFSRQLEVGGKVRFLAGPFAEMIGSLEHLDGRGRVRVFLTLFGRETEVKAHARDVIPMRDT